jgi:chitodextrinase
MSDYLTKENVVRVKDFVTETKFDEFFPHRDPFYTYDGFLKAVAKYPAFCNEDNADVTTPHDNTADVD